MFYYIASSILTIITSLFIGFFVYLRDRRNPINISWFCLSLSVAIWSIGYSIFITTSDRYVANSWRIFMDTGAILIPSFWLNFIFAFLGIIREKKRILILSYVCSVVVLFINFTPFFTKGLSKKFIFNFYPEAGLGYYLFILNFIIWVIYSFYGLFIVYKLSSGFKRNQIRYIIIGALLGFGGGGTAFFLTFNIPIPPFGLILFALYPLVITYAILRYRLMDITVAITRTGIFVAVYTIVLGLPFAVALWLKGQLIATFGSGWWGAPLGLMAALATVGPFIYIYLDRKAEERLLYEQKRYQDTLKQASIGMSRIRNLNKLLSLITHIVTKTVRISYAAIYLHNQETDEYVLQVSRDHKKVFTPKLNPDNPLVTWIVLQRQPLIYEEVKRQMQDTPNDASYKLLEESMHLLGASVVIPSFLEDKFMGFIVLGDKVSGQIYTPDDLSVFQVLASQAALAIENAQFYEEAKQMQEQIAQAEKMATVGTMADGLSHQINNRFHALSLIAGDTIDTIKLTDTTNCTPEVKEMVSQISHALDRIQSNVMQGAEVVKGILKYTRKGEEGLEALTIDQIIDGTLDMVQYKVKLAEIDIIRNYPKDTPKLKGNLVQLQEAFFNFIDNAYDATVERKTLLKEPDYRGRITMTAKPKDSNLEILIEDNGLGVKVENLKKVFTPFFTTKTSSRRGTGLGLYVIKRIITDLHKGSISFESEYKVGTRFILELPIAKPT